MTDLVKGAIPKGWRAYKVPDKLTAIQWIADFILRVDQLISFSKLALDGLDLRTARVWLGGLFVPEAFITATRQAVAQANSWSLEKLGLELDVKQNATDAPCNLEPPSLIPPRALPPLTPLPALFFILFIFYILAVSILVCSKCCCNALTCLPASDKTSFLLTGLRMDGATCLGDVVTLTRGKYFLCYTPCFMHHVLKISEYL